MFLVETGDAQVSFAPQRRTRKPVNNAPHNVAQRVTPQRIVAQEDHIGCQYEGANADSKRGFARGGVKKPERLPNVIRQEQQKEKGNEHEIAVDILHH